MIARVCTATLERGHVASARRRRRPYSIAMNLLLVGPRGSGKTTLGRAVAAATRLSFVDLDDLTLGRFAEDTVSDVWARAGEQAWRVAELDALRVVLADDEQVVALGGGTPIIEAARGLIERAQAAGDARVVYLKCSPEELVRRLEAKPGDRPALTDESDLEAEVQKVLAAREAIYETLADACYEMTAGHGQEQVVSGLLKQVR